MEKHPLIILTGPTAVGKTGLSIKFAKEIAGYIVSADSMQVYKYMDIGSAKMVAISMLIAVLTKTQQVKNLLT